MGRRAGRAGPGEESGESSPTIGPDGTLYVGGNETVTAVYTGLSGPAVTSWPQFGAGPGNTRIQQ